MGLELHLNQSSNVISSMTGGTLIVVAVTNPSGPHNKACYVRPAHSRWSIRPDREVHLLVMLEIWPLRFSGNPFQLHRLLSSPPNHKGANGSCDQVWVFPRRLYVSKMISRFGVVAMPTSADCGTPFPEMLDTTPYRWSPHE